MPQPFITSLTGGTTRNSQTGPAGGAFLVGPNALVVTALGRWTVSGNSQSHYVNLTTASFGSPPITLATVTINTSGLPVGFAFANIISPSVVLIPGQLYAVMAQETAAGDSNLDANWAVATTPDGTYYGSVYLIGANLANSPASSPYGGANFLYELQSNFIGGAPRMITWSY
jgi:hypothetical protein